jgi:hypothetical protein
MRKARRDMLVERRALFLWMAPLFDKFGRVY